MYKFIREPRVINYQALKTEGKAKLSKIIFSDLVVTEVSYSGQII